jgi:hypothetical protein
MQFSLCKYGHLQPVDDMSFMDFQLFYDAMIEYSKEEADANSKKVQ